MSLHAEVISCDSCHLQSKVDGRAVGWGSIFHPNGQRSDYCSECAPSALPPPPTDVHPYGGGTPSPMAAAA